MEGNGQSILLQMQQSSFDDVGDYDDEDEGDMPPPLPPWTEDALILVDPPPFCSLVDDVPQIHIYNTLTPNGSPLHTPHHHQHRKLAPNKPPPPVPRISRRHPPILKSRSQGDGLDIPPHDSGETYDKLSHGGPRRQRPRRSHEYEEIRDHYGHLAKHYRK